MLAAAAPDDGPADDARRALTGDGTSARSTPPDDPVLARLLPDFHASDAEAAGGCGCCTSRSSIAAKDAAAVELLDTLPQAADGCELDPGQAPRRWIAALNDVRLALGHRGSSVTEDDVRARRRCADDAGRPDLRRSTAG